MATYKLGISTLGRKLEELLKTYPIIIDENFKKVVLVFEITPLYIKSMCNLIIKSANSNNFFLKFHVPNEFDEYQLKSLIQLVEAKLLEYEQYRTVTQTTLYKVISGEKSS